MSDKILIIDDEPGIRSSLRGILEDEGFNVQAVASGEEGLALIKRENFDVILLDIWLEGLDGLEVLKKLKEEEEKAQVIMITGHGSVETAVRAIKQGAYDFLEKPLSLEKVVVTVKNALHQKKLEEENLILRSKFRNKYQKLVGESPVIKELKKKIAKAAARVPGKTKSLPISISRPFPSIFFPVNYSVTLRGPFLRLPVIKKERSFSLMEGPSFWMKLVKSTLFSR